ncbi:MAG: glycosyltransferase family 4 protein [Thermoplasmata archaeon]|nr:glycosyltransferase family 4 protein [Thermoplasmata archaeon]
MRIVLVGTGVYPIPPPGYGAIERLIAQYAHALQVAGQSVSVLQEVRRQQPVDEYWFAGRLKGLLHSQTADIVHAQTPVVGNRLASLGVPYVYTTHSRNWFSVRGLTQRWGFRLERRAISRSAATICPTDRLNAEVSRRLGTHRPAELPTIPIGIDVNSWRPAESPPGTVSALAVGAVIPIKRWEQAVAALAGTGIRLRLVGPVPDRVYAERVRSAGPVEILGEIPDAQLREEYHAASFLIHPSASEILPVAVLQAFACGIPVIGSEAIRPVLDDGVVGFIAVPDSRSNLAPSLRALAVQLRDDAPLRARLGAGARRSAEERYSWPKIVTAHLDLYEAVRHRFGPALPG